MDLKEMREALQPPEIITQDADGKELRITGTFVKFRDVIDLLPRLEEIKQLSFEDGETPLKKLVEDTCTRLNMDAAIPHILELPLSAQLVVIDDFFGCLRFGKPRTRTR